MMLVQIPVTQIVFRLAVLLDLRFQPACCFLRLLETYDRILPLNAQERTYLYYLFLYPEKYWKQLNFYYNAGKAWIPVRSIEKLQKLEEQQTARNLFLEAIR